MSESQQVKPVMLAELLRLLDERVSLPDQDVAVTGVELDSRRVQPGNLFVAVSGGTTDGHRYIPAALQAGACAVVGTQPLTGLEVPYIQVSDSREALAKLAAALYGHPARQLVMIGVTGTDGKTTTSNLLFHVLQAAGLRVGMISTVNAVIGNQVLDTGFHVTTPEASSVQAYLAQMVQAGLTHVVLETTSHGLAQRRVAACEFDMAVVTNITHEHLDYHGSYEAYRAAKGLLFEGLASTKPKPSSPPRGAVLNRDDQSFEYLSGITSVPWLSYGLSESAAVWAQDIEIAFSGLSFTAVGRDLAGQPFRLPLRSSLVGEYNVYNCLAALTLTLGVMHLSPEAVSAGLAAMRSVPGRMEQIQMGQAFTAIVDFAHTPNALIKTLEAARQLTSGRVIAVFGSAGLRDREKRRMMAEASAELADLSILTAEDPRTESLNAILAEMASGASARGAVEGQTFWRIPDRREALRLAVRLAKPGDLVIACGKGHEQSMCFGETEYAWDDRVGLRAALAESLGLPGPEMPYLPAAD
jgi:UDP-N-acetylmuramoyl-L-alanyl-D-glutamate--2,6-diaminopimelate ligase